MWSYSVIKDIVDEQTKFARERRAEPVPAHVLLDSYNITGQVKIVPFLGEYVAKGWELTEDTFFVDHGGKGRDFELALTIEQWIAQVRNIDPQLGLGIREQGPFQVVVGVYRRK